MDQLKNKLLELGVFEDNGYLDCYCNLILSNKELSRIPFATNEHHIVPRSYFEHEKIPIDNSPENLVHLYFKDHLLAHYYLALCTTGWFQFSNQCAMQWLTDKYKLDISMLDRYQEQYEQLQQRKSLKQRGRKLSEEECKKRSAALTGRTRSEQERESIRRGHNNMDSEKRKELSAYFHDIHSGRIQINNGVVQRMIHPEEFDSYAAQGFVKGCLPYSKERVEHARQKLIGYVRTDEFKNKCKSAHSGKIYINNGTRCIMIQPEDLSSYESEGWTKGRLRRT